MDSNKFTKSLQNNPDHMILACSQNVLAAPEQSSNQDISTSQQEVSWPDLLPELVLEIMHYLSYLEGRCVGNIIPKWLPTIRSTQKPTGANWNYDSPCLLSFSNDYKTCRLFDPVHNSTFLLETPNLPTALNILSCKHGWLLLMLSCDDLIFYNPLSKVVIKLPPFKKKGQFSFSFSSAPTSSNCVVVAQMITRHVRRIITCHKGDHKWTKVSDEFLDREVQNFEVNTSAVFFREKFHWLGSNGRIGVLDPITKAWDVHGMCINVPKTHRQYLVESDNKLFCIMTTICGDSVSVYEHNKFNHAWKKTKNLDGHSFFLSQVGSIKVSASSVGNKEERLYFPMFQHEQFVYYSMEARRMFPNGDFIGGKELLRNSCWIVPKWDTI